MSHGLERRVEYAVDVCQQRRRVDRGHPAPAIEQRRGSKGYTCNGPKLCDRLPVARHGDGLAAGDAVDDLAASVAQFADRHVSHRRNVSRVRHADKMHDPLWSEGGYCSRVGGRKPDLSQLSGPV